LTEHSEKKRVVGITGGLATGKTTVANMLSAKGATKIDADRIGHRILEEDAGVKDRLVGLFGEKILTGSNIDRVKLRKEVFFDAEQMKKLNDILHPGIIASIREEINCFKGGTLLIDAPLLIEAGMREDVDIVVVITADYETQIKRARERGFTEDEAKRVIAAQMPLSKKRRFADYIIDNDGNLKKTKEGVEKLWHKMKNL